MAFFDDLKKEAIEIGNMINNESEEKKLNRLIAEENERIEMFYKQIGQKYYELNNEKYDQAFESMIVGIKAAQVKIQEYNDQIKLLKGIVTCTNCGGNVMYGSAFCNICGSPIALPQQQNNAGGRTCKQCGSIVAEGCLFCTTCGTKYEEAEEIKEAEETEIFNPMQGEIIEQNAGEMNEAFNEPEINVDESMFEMQMDFEPEIFRPDSIEEDEGNYVAENVVQNIDRICHVCGNKLDADDVFCIICGARF